LDNARLASTPEVSGDTLNRVIDSYRTTPEAQRRYKADDAAGWCEESMEDFIRHAKQHGVEASRHEFNYPLRSAFPTPHRSLGWGKRDYDEEQDQWDGFHYAPIVNVGGNPHVVDWTMNQLKPDAQFPHVEPLNSYGSRFAYHVPYEPPYPYYDDDPHTAARLAGANGDLPENLHFREHQGWTHAYDGEHLIGYLRPAQGKIDMIKVAPEYRRQGVGTAMLDWHRNNVDPDLGHSTDQTPLGRAWGRSVGWNPPVWNRQDPDIDTLEDYEVERGPHTAARLAMPQRQKWYHVSPHDLPEGTVLKSGPGSWAGLVHFTDSPEHGRYWRENLARDEFGDNFDGQEGHLYEIEPSEKPRANSRSFDYVAPSAVVRRKVPMPPLPAEYDSPEWHAWYESTWPKRDEDEAHNQPWWPYEQPQSKKKAKYMTAAVTVYTKPNCPQCTMTKKQLDRLGIEHQTVDVTADPDAHAYVTGLGYQQAPVVVVGDGERHWGGFSPDKLKGLIE
jgi:glutaredoxin-like protein NrdH